MKKFGGRMFRCLALLGAVIFLLFGWGPKPHSVRARSARATLAPAAISTQPVLTTGLSSPLYVTSAHDGTNRLFIVEQTGKIKVLQPGAAAATDFLDVSAKIVSGGERGLLGLAFHPQFKINGSFFIDYTRTGDGATVIAEYHASPTNPNVADTNERILLTVSQPFANHNGGMIEFGPDKYLYIGKGDGGSGNDPGNRAQSIDDLHGKILRLDIDHLNGAIPYSSPPDNPFFGATPGLDEIFALGMRNPWRFSFDRGTGQLYVGDVGQASWEEVDLVTLGGNYGWRVFEGNHCTNNDPALCSNPNNYIFPILEYGHTLGRCSITGGYVYRGPKNTLPAGTYVFGDYCTGEIFTPNGSAPMVLLDTSFNISSFGEDEAGELYVVDLNGGVYRLVSDAAPPCSFTLSAASQAFPADSGAAPLTGSVNVTAAQGCSWTTTNNNPEFIIVNSGSGNGNGTVTFTVADNPNASRRTGMLTVAGQTFTVLQGAKFPDVDPSNQFNTEIGKLSARQVTQGCGSGNFCPDAFVTREQMAIFIIKALGILNPPQPASQRFADVDSSRGGYAFIDELARRGITVGCGGNSFCPDTFVTRESMAIFVERALREYVPPTPTGQSFDDVSPAWDSFPFIEDLYRRRITQGCGARMYCPGRSVTRGEMAAFLGRAFGL